MGERITLHLPFPGQTFDLEAEVSEDSFSPHTGRPLRKAEMTVDVAAGQSDDFKQAIEEATAADDQGGVWSGSIRTESYTSDGSGPHHFLLDWAEQEDLRAERVEFGGLILTPSQYKEESSDADDNVVVITFLATLTPQEAERFRELEAERADPARRYWPVVRVGVSDQPRTMRLGQSLWSRRDDVNIDYLVILVDAANDELPDNGTWRWMGGEPALGRAVELLADVAEQFQALVSLLEQHSVIDGEARKLLDEAGAQARAAKRYMFYEVDDVAAWWL